MGLWGNERNDSRTDWKCDRGMPSLRAPAFPHQIGNAAPSLSQPTTFMPQSARCFSTNQPQT
eukprot:8730195-Lingulodinium_polyedra.AAC.1